MSNKIDIIKRDKLPRRKSISNKFDEISDILRKSNKGIYEIKSPNTKSTYLALKRRFKNFKYNIFIRNNKVYVEKRW